MFACQPPGHVLWIGGNGLHKSGTTFGGTLLQKAGALDGTLDGMTKTNGTASRANPSQFLSQPLNLCGRSGLHWLRDHHCLQSFQPSLGGRDIRLDGGAHLVALGKMVSGPDQKLLSFVHLNVDWDSLRLLFAAERSASTSGPSVSPIAVNACSNLDTFCLADSILAPGS